VRINKLVTTALFSVLCVATSVVFATPNIQHWKTDNGARVYFVQAAELPLVDVRVVFDAGAARDGDMPGIALMTNGMMSEGAGGWDADNIAERFDSVGAQFSNSSHRDMSVFNLRTLSEKEWMGTAVKTFATILSKPTFPADAFERERKRLLISLEQNKESPESISGEKLFENLYRGHPYASIPEGTEQSVKALKRTDLMAYYRRYMVGNNAIVAIVGAMDRKSAEALAKTIVGELEPGKAAEPLPEVKDRQQAEEVVVDFPSTQSHISIALPGMKRSDPDEFALYVGNHILGGSGLVSILSDEIREKRGLSYSSYSYFAPMRVQGPFIMGLQTRNDQAQEALKVMRQTLSEFINNGPSARQLESAKKNIVGGYALRMDSNKKIIDQVASIGFYGLELDYLDTYIARVQAVSVDQIKDAFMRRVNPENMLTVIVGAQTPAQAAN